MIQALLAAAPSIASGLQGATGGGGAETSSATSTGTLTTGSFGGGTKDSTLVMFAVLAILAVFVLRK